MIQHKLKWLPFCASLVFLLPVDHIFGQGITVNPGAQMIINGAGINLVVNNGSINNEGVIAAGNNTTVRMEGNAPTTQSLLGGSGPTTLHHLSISKSVNDVALNGNIITSGTIDMNTGKLILNNHMIDMLGTGVISNEGAFSYISGLSGGEIRRTAVMNAPAATNPGNIGLAITSGQNLGNVLIKRRYERFNVSASDVSIGRYYEITPENNTDLNANVRFFYHDEDLGGAMENDLYFWTSANQGIDWTFRNRDANNAPQNYVDKNGLNTLDWIALATPNVPFPLDLLSFTATLVNHQGVLNWETAREDNVSHFEIQRGSDGKNFIEIGRVDARISPALQQEYTFTDQQMLGGANYYRLRIVDVNGSVTFSKVEMLQSLFKNELLQVYPNPVRNNVWISLTSSKKAGMTLSLVDIIGRVVLEKEIDLETGFNKIELETADLIDGNYLIKFSQPELGAVKIVKHNQY